MAWLGRASISFSHAPSPLALNTRDGSVTDLLEVCKAATPPCRLNCFLFNGHLQTSWTALGDHGPPIYYKRRLFESSDHHALAGTFAVDFVVEPFQEAAAHAGGDLPPRTAYFSDEDFSAMGSQDSCPMLLILHGLSGGSHEIYLRYCIAPIINNGQDWRVCVINSRGCAQHKLTSGVMFNARATWDIRQVVKWARQTFPNRPLFALGFSLGANILTNYVGEEGAECVLKAAVAVANPFNLELSSMTMQRTRMGRLYQTYMGANMRQLLQSHRETLENYTDINFDHIAKTKTLYEFDRLFQTAAWGYPTVGAYYRDASSSEAVLAIRIPFLAINALDDPIAVYDACPVEEFQQNPCTVLCTTSLGGHLSWFELGGGRWHARPVTNFFTRMVAEIRLDAIKPEPGGVFTRKAALCFKPMRRKWQLE